MLRPVSYSAVAAQLTAATAGQWPSIFRQSAVEEWCIGYRQLTPRFELLEVAVDGFFNLFDLVAERSLGAFGLSQGRHAGARDSSRMAGHPQSAGADFHRGHLIAHTLGGGTDINLFGQRGALNIGDFRALERAAAADPGCLHFVRLHYERKNSGQLPDEIEQGYFPSGGAAGVQVRQFRN